MAKESPTQTVLVVDDDLGLLRLIQKALEREGFRAAAVASGQEAASWVEKNHADLLVVDLKLQDIEGRELITRLEAAGHAIPFIIITGQGDERVAVEMMKHGALDYLVKDVNFIEFVPAVVARAFARIGERRRLAEAEAALLGILEQERTRVAADLHDGICQELVGVQFLAGTLRKDLEKARRPQAAQARRIEDAIGAAAAHTRQVAHGMIPVAAHGHGLMGALRQLAGTTVEMHRVQCVFECPEEVLVECPKAANELYRIAQEAVLNALRHGKAKRITIRLSATETEITLTVTDNGGGLPPDAAHSAGMGLRVMKHRADQIGGQFSIQPRKRGGTQIECRIAKPAGKP